MGFFSTKRKIYVASSTWNMAGEVQTRLRYLKATVCRFVLDPSPPRTKGDFGENFVRAYLNGPGIRQRGFFRWAEDHYPEGKVTGKVTSFNSIDGADVISQISHPGGTVVQISEALIDDYDIDYFAEAWLLANDPTKSETDWSADYDSVTQEIVIEFEDLTTSRFSHTIHTGRPPLVLARYILTGPDIVDPTVTGSLVPGGTTEPSETATMTLLGSSSVSVSRDMTETVTVTVTDSSTGDPPSVTVTSGTYTSLSYSSTHKHWQRTDLAGVLPDGSGFEKFIVDLWTFSRPGVVIETTTDTSVSGTVTTETVTEREVWDPLGTIYWDWREDSTRVVSNPQFGTRKIFIYPVGTGNATLDALVDLSGIDRDFFPFIEVRADNKMADHPDHAASWPIKKKAYKKATGDEFPGLLDKIRENDNLGDIDHIFMVHGVPLNTPEDEGKLYLYKFFKTLMDQQITSPAQLSLGLSAYELYLEDIDNTLEWMTGQTNPLSTFFGLPAPTRPQPKLPARSSIVIKGTSNPRFDMEITWSTISEETGTGQIEPGAKTGQLFIRKILGVSYTSPFVLTAFTFSQHPRQETITRFTIGWQDGTNSWRKLTVWGLVHTNRVYKGKSVITDSDEALEDEEESGLVIPLSYDILRDMPIVKATQLALSNRLLVFNCYKVVKIKWYQRGFFRIIITIILAVIGAIIFPGAIGLLGSNVAVGASLGFSGLLGAVIGGVANALAGVVLATLIEAGASAIFGEKIGGILSGLISVLLFQVVSGMGQGLNFAQSLAASWNQFTDPANLLKLLDTGTEAYGAWVQGEVTRMGENTADFVSRYEQMARELEKRALETLGSGDGSIDPLMFTQASMGILPVESSNTFLTRTLLSGSDLVDLSHDLIEQFAELNLLLPDPNF